MVSRARFWTRDKILAFPLPKKQKKRPSQREPIGPSSTSEWWIADPQKSGLEDHVLGVKQCTSFIAFWSHESLQGLMILGRNRPTWGINVCLGFDFAWFGYFLVCLVKFSLILADRDAGLGVQTIFWCLFVWLNESHIKVGTCPRSMWLSRLVEELISTQADMKLIKAGLF